MHPPVDGDGHPVEAAPYHESVRRVERANHRLWRAVAMVAIGVCVLLGLNDAYLANEVSQIRTTQDQNTAVARCQDRAFDQVLRELLLAQPITAPPAC